jgi:hypothetical protein
MLTAVMLLMGMTMVAGSARALFGNALLPLDQELGTHSSAAAAVLGIGLMAAAINPSANIGWVRAGILYGVVTIAFEIGAYYLIGATFYIGPVIFGVAASLLLIALYPQRSNLMPPVTEASTTPPAKAAPATPKTPVA